MGSGTAFARVNDMQLSEFESAQPVPVDDAFGADARDRERDRGMKQSPKGPPRPAYMTRVENKLKNNEKLNKVKPKHQTAFSLRLSFLTTDEGDLLDVSKKQRRSAKAFGIAKRRDLSNGGSWKRVNGQLGSERLLMCPVRMQTLVAAILGDDGHGGSATAIKLQQFVQTGLATIEQKLHDLRQEHNDDCVEPRKTKE